ncbi:cation diffusion facilitator family transporter [Chloroflexota bacterium]
MQLAVGIGLVVNIILAGLKTSIGIIGHSPALLADGINSTVDVAYYVVVGFFIRVARQPPDEEHPYGHRQFESIAGIAVGAFVITTGITIFWNATNTIFELVTGTTDFSGASQLALWVALLTVAIKLILTAYTRRIGRQTKSSTVMALAYDHRNDVFSALAATVGILLGRMGYFWVDPLAGAIVALVILRTGIEIIMEASGDLITPNPSNELTSEITTLLTSIHGVQQVEELYVQHFGPYMTVDVTIGVDGNLTVTEGHRIASLVEKTLYDNILMMRRVHVHYHPSDTRLRLNSRSLSKA